jgi:thymidine kinase
MFSGKTEELIRRLRRAKIANQNVAIFKPKIDTRYHDTEIVSHNANSIVSTPVDFSSEILLQTTDIDVVGIDEVQFFDANIVAICQQLADSGVRVIIAGLDMDYRGKPFGSMPQLLAIAEYVTKVNAICMQCGDLALYSHRKTTDNNTLLLGETESYEPLCRSCFNAVMSISAG